MGTVLRCNSVTEQAAIAVKVRQRKAHMVNWEPEDGESLVDVERKLLDSPILPGHIRNTYDKFADVNYIEHSTKI